MHLRSSLPGNRFTMKTDRMETLRSSIQIILFFMLTFFLQWLTRGGRMDGWIVRLLLTLEVNTWILVVMLSPQKLMVNCFCWCEMRTRFYSRFLIHKRDSFYLLKDAPQHIIHSIFLLLLLKTSCRASSGCINKEHQIQTLPAFHK